MSFEQRADGSGPLRPEPVEHLSDRHEERRSTRTRQLARGSLACPRCDAPVALTAGPRRPSDGLDCPFCAHAAPVRDFLSLGAPTRPARVEVRLILAR